MAIDYDEHIKQLKNAAQTSTPAVKKVKKGKQYNPEPATAPYDWEHGGTLDNAIAGPLCGVIVMMIGLIAAGHLDPYMTIQGVWALGILYAVSGLITLAGMAVAVFEDCIVAALYCFVFALIFIALAAVLVLVCYFFWVYVPGVL